jgi:hypothetical protein
MSVAHRARRAENVTRKAASNSALEFLERVGYVVRGTLYSTMGTLALGVALGIGGAATDQSGSLVILTRGPFGKFLLLAVAIGISAYAVWGFVRAIFDPLHRGDDAPGVAQRLGFAWSGFAYTGLALFALQLFAGTGGAGGQDSTHATIAAVLNHPAGQLATVLIGLVALAAGIGQFVEAYRAEFKKDMKRGEMSKGEKEIVDTLGRLGMIARGVTFSLVGWFVLEAGLHHDSSRAHGFGAAFLFLLNQPFGRQLLALVALGFIALGLHSFACARWVRLLGSKA